MMRRIRSMPGRGTAPRLRAGDAAYMSDIREALLVRSSAGAQLILYLIAIVLGAGLVWAHFARVEEVTRSEATVVSPSREQLIQSLEGGIVQSVAVREGEVVEKGQLLAKIDPARAQSSYREVLTKALELKASVSRARAEAYGVPLDFPEDVKRESGLVAQATATYRARRRALDEQVTALEKSQALVRREIAMSEPLAAKGLVSEVEILRMRRQSTDIAAQIAERRSRFTAEASTELSRLEQELAQTNEVLAGRADVLARTDVVAPMRGVVKNIRIRTAGGVVQSGEHIMEIAPLDGRVLVEARIKPSDVAFLRPGLPVLVKLSAYDFSIYGGLHGHVVSLGPDTLKDDQKAAMGRPDANYYRLMVETDSDALAAAGKRLPVLPGMQATVDIRTGEKTVLDYLLKPIFKAREAFRER
ncbi:HlyD family type I secretion periplasmic adaptor subunit [Burkholderia ambifaria]|jgi:adhesin transport system membrane fusion protein|uniref:Membrane fusion protein (MFP) family protein n=1 Tax=Burkholderia ambifaria (strain ATCC BAA-244 / DSM 16087 / CCUG 44356 / LMG 19182 / AMMD) TaxID=339670 RepID=Q0BAW9_BURCM|nr:type I secretion membrane fusion protein, HlyD family [Burkholderia ambifaria AMMD]ELK6210772.1 HlyD family type I secretion periplasmic adaptor subunit [Burkholderia ambifaria]AJY22036.1 type I secretion membrane fusion, HlyD family protein [Burkholderia ambifaria AMMD]MBR7935077.1 HlyD family type I secretion periplasmic adaptor subunit [Burkholderia ambifaria]MBR8348135.1 HlyD family type I secretion periplasmic adaptor subunit [Burkholderia ambifaria]